VVSPSGFPTKTLYTVTNLKYTAEKRVSYRFQT